MQCIEALFSEVQHEAQPLFYIAIWIIMWMSHTGKLLTAYRWHVLVPRYGTFKRDPVVCQVKIPGVQPLFYSSYNLEAGMQLMQFLAAFACNL